jgi:secreted PhoX family phosphatase
MLAIAGSPTYETAIGQQAGTPLPVTWVPILDPDPDPVRSGSGSAVYAAGRALGGAQFRRLEGCWEMNRKIYFASTNGGDAGFGQIWMHDPVASTLTLIAESPHHDVFDGPDNICATPGGGLIACEDAGAAQFLRGITPAGEIFDFARNLRNTIEFAGVCFSPDGGTLFVNLYGRGSVRTVTPYRSPVQLPLAPERYERAATVAIWGPWKSGPL